MTSLTDGADNVTTFVYDYRDRLKTTTYEDNSTQQYRYYADGSLHYRKERNWTADLDTPSGDYVLYEYDAVGRLETVTYPNDGSIEYTYDDASRVKQAIVKDATSTELHRIEWDYNNAGWVTKERQKLGASQKEIEYSGYDDNGNVTQIDYPGGKTLTLTYDEMNRVAEIKESTDVVAAYDYNAVGQPTRLDLLNDTAVLYAYDAAGRLTALSNRYPEDVVLSSFHYTRTGEGDPTMVTLVRLQGHNRVSPPTDVCFLVRVALQGGRHRSQGCGCLDRCPIP